MQECDTNQMPEPMPSRSGARWGQERRLEFIDYRLAWDTQLNRSDLTTFFGISVPQASLDLAEYAKRAPGNLDYDPRTRAYRASPTFQAVFPASDVERYLGDLARVAQAPGVPYGSFLGDHPAVAYVPRPWRRADSDTVLAVSNAIRHHEALTISYQSLSQTGPRTRSVSPHAMVSDGFRWHFRAYCHTNDDYRDFVLARITAISGSMPDQDRQPHDSAWHQLVALVLAPHPDLPPAHRNVVERDYGMVDGTRVLECRQAVVFYVLKQLGLDREADPWRTPGEQQIVLQNRCDILGFLPKTSVR